MKCIYDILLIDLLKVTCRKSLFFFFVFFFPAIAIDINECFKRYWHNTYDTYKHAVLSSKCSEFQKLWMSDYSAFFVNVFSMCVFHKLNGIWVSGVCNFT